MGKCTNNGKITNNGLFYVGPDGIFDNGLSSFSTENGLFESSLQFVMRGKFTSEGNVNIKDNSLFYNYGTTQCSNKMIIMVESQIINFSRFILSKKKNDKLLSQMDIGIKSNLINLGTFININGTIFCDGSITNTTQCGTIPKSEYCPTIINHGFCIMGRDGSFNNKSVLISYKFDSSIESKLSLIRQLSNSNASELTSISEKNTDYKLNGTSYTCQDGVFKQNDITTPQNIK